MGSGRRGLGLSLAWHGEKYFDVFETGEFALLGLSWIWFRVDPGVVGQQLAVVLMIRSKDVSIVP
jgi:hypothetical protein